MSGRVTVEHLSGMRPQIQSLSHYCFHVHEMSTEEEAESAEIVASGYHSDYHVGAEEDVELEEAGGHITPGGTGCHCFFITACYMNFILVLNMSQLQVTKYLAGKEQFGEEERKTCATGHTGVSFWPFLLCVCG